MVFISLVAKGIKAGQPSQIIMNSLIRQIRAHTSSADPTSKSEGLAKTDRPAPRSTLGLRIVNPYLVDALIE